MQPEKTPDLPNTAAYLPPITYEPASSFASKPVQAAYDYWQSLRGVRLMPLMDELKQRDMRAFVDNVGIVEIRNDQASLSEYFVRFAGSRVEAIFGARTGRTLSDGVPDEIAVRWRSSFDMVRRSAKPVRATAHVAFEGKTETEVEVFVAPLGEDVTPAAFFVAIDALRSHRG